MERAATRLGAAVAIVALLGALAAFYAVRASGAAHVHVVTTANNKTLGKKILVNRKGMTLYSLSVERKGHPLHAREVAEFLEEKRQSLGHKIGYLELTA